TAGNITTTSAVTATVDTTAPAAPAVALTTDSGSSSTDKITNVGALNLSGVESDATVQYSIDGGTTWSSSFTAVEGANTVQVLQADVAGNVSNATSFSFRLDTTAPSVTESLSSDTGASSTDRITNVATLTGTGE